MLGALNLGDIGTNFPSTKEWRDAPGRKLFSLAYEKVRNEGYKLLQFDVIVIAEQPKMSRYREEILRSLSEITSVSEKNIGFKAKTAENMGFIGNNEGAAAMVISRLSR
jgi:2-C-methyl-D-erythritol 2,4-cyclodiphosphate synthase